MSQELYKLKLLLLNQPSTEFLSSLLEVLDEIARKQQEQQTAIEKLSEWITQFELYKR